MSGKAYLSGAPQLGRALQWAFRIAVVLFTPFNHIIALESPRRQ
jgi:hypothetical protein